MPAVVKSGFEGRDPGALSSTDEGGAKALRASFLRHDGQWVNNLWESFEFRNRVDES